MRLLVTTQAVDLDDPVLAFFHRWLEELATQFDAIEIICLKEGRYELPANVHVQSLGKERGVRSRVAHVLRFYRLLWRLHGRYDAVFVHMNPEYVVLAGLWWRLGDKRVVLWYTHRNVSLMLRLAVALASAVATAASESLCIASPKVHVIGHGIDTAAFAAERDGALHKPLAIVTVGRITPIKRLEVLLDALALLRGHKVHAALDIVGAPMLESDQVYAGQLHAHALELGIEEYVRFAGAVAYKQMPGVYHEHDLSVNLAPTGGIDKAVLEAMAAGCLPLVANHAFLPLLGTDADALVFDDTADGLAAKIKALTKESAAGRAALAARLAQAARREADVGALIGRLAGLIKAA